MTEKEQKIIEYIELILVPMMTMFNLGNNDGFSEDNHKSKLKEISSYGDNKINDIMDFVRENINDPIDDILKGVLDIMRGEVQIDYTYLTNNIQATGNIDITGYTKTSPYPSWIIGDDGEWTPPVPYPDGDGSGMETLYNWNETKKSWEDILV